MVFSHLRLFSHDSGHLSPIVGPLVFFFIFWQLCLKALSWNQLSLSVQRTQLNNHKCLGMHELSNACLQSSRQVFLSEGWTGWVGKTGPPYAVQAVLDQARIFLPLSLDYWGHKCVPPRATKIPGILYHFIRPSFVMLVFPMPSHKVLVTNES